MDSTKESIRRVSKGPNTFELSKSTDTYLVELNGKELAQTRYQDISNVVFDYLISRY